MVTIRIPALPRGLSSNLLGLFGLVAVVAAVGGLSGNWWWSVLIGGLFAVGLAGLAQMSQAQAEEQAGADLPARPVSRIGVA